LTKNKKLLKHIVLKDEIKDIIYGDDYSIGDRIPGENELCQQLNVSRVTLRKALDLLVSERIISRKRGSGTVILKKPQKYKYDLSVAGKLSDIVGEENKITTTMIKITEKKSSKTVAERLKISEDALILVYERVRSINNSPAVYSIDNIAKERVPENAIYENMGPSLSQSIGIGLHFTEATVKPVKATPYICELLNITPGSLCLCFEETTFDISDNPLDYSHEYYPEYMFNFKLFRLNREELRKFNAKF